MSHDSQRLKIQRYMAQGKVITPEIAYRISKSHNLCQRIREIEKHFNVASDWFKSGKARFKGYWIPQARDRSRAAV